VIELTEETIVKCTECASRNLEKDDKRGEVVCLDCGLVLAEDVIDQGAEWNVYNPEDGDKKSRAGAPTNMLLHDKGLSTDIDWQNRDFSGKAISASNRSQLHRMRKWQARARSSNSRERNLQNAMQEMSSMGARLELPRSIQTEAAVIYRRALEANIIRGRSIPGVAAACLYIACELAGVPRPIADVSHRLRMGKKELGRTIRQVKLKLRIRTRPKEASQFIGQFCSKLGLAAEIEGACQEMFSKIKSLELDSGRGPTGLAAAIIYISAIVGGQRRTQRDIADVSGVTEVTIRNRYKELAAALEIDLGDLV
tara:strand:- start:26 stop:958 length:933 start_codon:yes stop_codon:yes gene_type:complete